MGNLKLEGDTIMLIYPDGKKEIYKMEKNPNYIVGTIFIDFNHERFFLK